MTDADIHDQHVSELWVDDGRAESSRRGLSCCDDLESLLEYFAGHPADGVSIGRGAALAGAYLVELEGEPSGDEPWEGEDTESLIHPTRIVRQEPVGERFVTELARTVQKNWCDSETEHAYYSSEHDEFRISLPCQWCDGTGSEDGEECELCDGSGRE